ncbi:MAG TPA: preprotein translocase subunit SecG [Pyrinomonadaceae bacterium]|nr:preprotein translocase subunit SecG [Pyrinomonadaceae bacterium]
MVYVLYTIFFLSCIVLVGSVLLQPGKTDAGALFTSNISSSAFAPRGTTTILSKVTITAAVVFMLSALLLAMPALNGNVSVLSSNPESATDQSANTNANTDANTTVTIPDANANASANVATSSDNSNGALIQTPATDEATKKAANAATTGDPAGNANTGKKAPAANAPGKK